MKELNRLQINRGSVDRSPMGGSDLVMMTLAPGITHALVQLISHFSQFYNRCGHRKINFLHFFPQDQMIEIGAVCEV